MEWPAITRVMTGCARRTRVLAGLMRADGPRDDGDRFKTRQPAAPRDGCSVVCRRSVRFKSVHRVRVNPAHCIGVSGETASA